MAAKQIMFDQVARRKIYDGLSKLAAPADAGPPDKKSAPF